MHVLVITRKNKLNTILMGFFALVVLLAVVLLFRFVSPETELTLEQRISFLLPSSAEMTTLYMTSLQTPSAEAGSLLGKRWKTEKILQLEMSEITFQYPETLRMDEIRNLGQEIHLHMNYQHINNKAYGFFQVWRLNQPLTDFLKASKKYSSMTFLDFKESPLKVQDLNGYLWEYTFINKTDDIVGMEAFLENGSELYRFTLYVSRQDYKTAYKKLFTRMVNSLRVKGPAALPNKSYVHGP